MKLLLDTHLLLWAVGTPGKLSAAAKDLLQSEENQLYFSAASIWEIIIKKQLARPDFQVDARLLRRGLIDNGYHEIAMESEHAVCIESLPQIHKDPFDRMLVAQATIEGFTLLTSDEVVARYPGPIGKI